MPPKKRLKENRRLPQRWRWKAGSIRYQVPPGQEGMWDGKKEFTLGRTEAEAYKTWADRAQFQSEIRTVGELLERYLHEVVPQKATKTQESNRISIARLNKVFARVPIWDVKPRHAYRYMDMVAAKHGQASANRDNEGFCQNSGPLGVVPVGR